MMPTLVLQNGCTISVLLSQAQLLLRFHILVFAAFWNQASRRQRRNTCALQVDAEIKEIDGASALIPARRYGEPVSAEKVRANLTLRLLIEQKSPQLAVYFGLDAGVAHRRLEEKEARELLKQRMQMLTEKSRAANEQARQDREVRQNLAPWQRGYRSI